MNPLLARLLIDFVSNEKFKKRIFADDNVKKNDRKMKIWNVNHVK